MDDDKQELINRLIERDIKEGNYSSRLSNCDYVYKSNVIHENVKSSSRSWALRFSVLLSPAVKTYDKHSIIMISFGANLPYQHTSF